MQQTKNVVGDIDQSIFNAQKNIIFDTMSNIAMESSMDASAQWKFKVWLIININKRDLYYSIDNFYKELKMSLLDI